MCMHMHAPMHECTRVHALAFITKKYMKGSRKKCLMQNKETQLIKCQVKTLKVNATVFVRKCHLHFKLVVRSFQFHWGHTPPVHPPISELFHFLHSCRPTLLAFSSLPFCSSWFIAHLLCISDKTLRKFRFMKKENENQVVYSSGKQILSGRNVPRSQGKAKYTAILRNDSKWLSFRLNICRISKQA